MFWGEYYPKRLPDVARLDRRLATCKVRQCVTSEETENLGQAICFVSFILRAPSGLHWKNFITMASELLKYVDFDKQSLWGEMQYARVDVFKAEL
jgi:hypothetical protein